VGESKIAGSGNVREAVFKQGKGFQRMANLDIPFVTETGEAAKASLLPHVQ